METKPSLTLPQPLLEPAGSEPGIYALILRLEETRAQKIGHLGMFTFPAGTYLYVGSARGPGGIAARVGRHIQEVSDKRRHWHIDWLRQIAWPIGLIWSHADATSECLWAEILSAQGLRKPARFGASDCRCPGHLIRCQLDKDLNSIRVTLCRMDGAELNLASFGQAYIDP